MARLALLVTPRAAVDRAGPYANGVLRVRVTRPPADGDANRAVIRVVASALGVAPGRVTLVGGSRGRRKLVDIDGMDDATLARRLGQSGAQH